MNGSYYVIDLVFTDGKDHDTSKFPKGGGIPITNFFPFDVRTYKCVSLTSS